MAAEFLAAQGFVVLDGGLATELERQGADLVDSLWSAKLLLENPELIRRVHESYFAASADVAVSASYQASVSGFTARAVEVSGQPLGSGVLHGHGSPELGRRRRMGADDSHGPREAGALGKRVAPYSGHGPAEPELPRDREAVRTGGELVDPEALASQRIGLGPGCRGGGDQRPERLGLHEHIGIGQRIDDAERAPEQPAPFGAIGLGGDEILPQRGHRLRPHIA